MATYYPFACYPDDINSITCTVFGGLGNYTSPGNKKLSIRIAEELEERGIKAYYSKPYGLGGGRFFVGYPLHQLIEDIRNAFHTLHGIKSAIELILYILRCIQSFCLQIFTKKVNEHKCLVMISLEIYTSKKLDDYTLATIGKRLMQINLLVEHIQRELTSEMSDCKFLPTITLRLTKYKSIITITSGGHNDTYSKKLNSWLLKYKPRKGVNLMVEKGRFNRLRITSSKYVHYPPRVLSYRKIRSLNYENDNGS